MAGDDVLTLPPSLAARPTFRGLPVPYSVPWSGCDDGAEGVGVPDFKGTDPLKWTWITTRRLCALCGEPVSGYLAFLGGPACELSGVFSDPGMHEECARAATRLCPFVRGVKDYSAVTKRGSRQPLEGPAVHPGAMLLMFANAYKITVIDGGPYVRAELPWLHVEQLPKHRRTAALRGV